MTYYLYHIPGKKIGVTRDLKERVENQQGYNEDEYVILAESKDITFISNLEINMQKAFGYKVDIVPYNKLKFNKTKMNINITEQTTTFPCPANKLKGQLMDNIGMTWGTDHGEFIITPITIKWIMKNIKTSMFNEQRSYIYNKAFARFYDNNDIYVRDKVETLAGGMSEQKVPECCDEYNPCTCEPEFDKRPKHKFTPHTGLNDFDLIRMWANQRGIYEHGDTKTQSLKLVEEVGEICRAILKEDHDEVVDGIGDAVVVLTNLAELQGVRIEDCIKTAYKVIAQRSGKMVNGTFKKD
jgi:NTP pyrophosphatase (non-canonical NTP hydrolase)